MSKPLQPEAVTNHVTETLSRWGDEYVPCAADQQQSGYGAIMRAISERIDWTKIDPLMLQNVVCVLLAPQTEKVLAELLELSKFERKNLEASMRTTRAARRRAA